MSLFFSFFRRATDLTDLIRVNRAAVLDSAAARVPHIIRILCRPFRPVGIAFGRAIRSRVQRRAGD